MTRSSAVSIAHAMPSAAQLPALAAVAAAARGLSAGLAKRPGSGDAACGSDILASRQRTARTSRTRDLTNEPDFQPHDTSEPQRRDAEPSDATLGAAEASVHAPLEAGSDEALLVQSTENQTTDSPETVDCNVNCHSFFFLS